MAKYVCRNEHYSIIHAQPPSRYAFSRYLEVGTARQVNFFVCMFRMMVMLSVECRQYLGFDHGQSEQDINGIIPVG